MSSLATGCCRPIGLIPGRRWRVQTSAIGIAIPLLLMVAQALGLNAQQAKPEPETPQGPSQLPQEPSTGPQVRTGMASGLDMDARLENLLADHQYFRVESELNRLPPRQGQVYRGILANRNNDAKKSIELLEPLVDDIRKTGNRAQEKLVRKALAEDYLRDGDWAKAAAAYQALDADLGGTLSRDEQDEIEMPLKILPLAENHPTMAVDACDPFELHVSRNPLGLIDIPVFVDARPHSWMLDPTAPFNLIARSLAREAGLTISANAATIRTLTGRPMQVHVTVVPRFTIGGRLALRNMTAFVFDDADYSFPQSGYQVEGVLGYAALQALGSLTITGNASILVRPAKEESPARKDDRLTSGARFFLDGDQLIVALGGPAGASGASGISTDDPAERMFMIDMAGQQTYLTSRYFNEHSTEFEGRKTRPFSLPGQSAASSVPAYTAETVTITTGSSTVELHDLPVLTQPLGSAARDDVYGVLGVDALDQLGGYRFDYRTMRFSVQPE